MRATTTATTARQSTDIAVVRVTVGIVHHHCFLQSISDETSLAEVATLHAFDDVEYEFAALGIVLCGGGATEIFEGF